MEELILYIVKNLVSSPEEVDLKESREDNTINFTLTVKPEDMGMVIGKGGQTIKAIRKLMIVRAQAENIQQRVYLNLAEVK